jgi:hypothetical protein
MLPQTLTNVQLFLSGWLNGIATNVVTPNPPGLVETGFLIGCFYSGADSISQDAKDVRWYVHNAVDKWKATPPDYDGFNNEMACAQPLIKKGLESCTRNSYF